MRVLLDECVPMRLRQDLATLSGNLTVETARYAGLSHLSNGALLAAMEGRFDTLVTTDKALRFQQNMTGRSVSIVVIASVNIDITELRPLMPQVVAVLATIRPGEIIDV